MHKRIKLKEKADKPRCSQDCPPTDGCWHVEAVLHLRDSKPLYPQSQPKKEKSSIKTYFVKKLFVVVAQAKPRMAGLTIFLSTSFNSMVKFIRSIARKINK